MKDLKKILPIWGIIIFLAVVTIVGLKLFNIAIINYIQYPPNNPYLLSRALMEEGIKYYRICLDIAEKQKKNGKTPKLKDEQALLRSKNLFLKSLELHPAHTEIYRYLATLAELEADKVMTYYYQGLILIHSQPPQIDEGLAFLDKALKINGRQEQVLAKKIEILIEKKALAEAETLLKDLISVNPLNDKAYYLAGLINTRKHQLQEAINNASRALELNPKNLDAARLCANLLAEQKKLDSAIQVLKRAEEHYPQNANLKHTIGRWLYEQGKYYDAYKYWLRAEKLEKFSAPLYLDLARVTKNLGKEHLSSLYLQKALDLDPKLKQKILSSE
ncbi:MAG: tetratricopeptide repeat protein [Candidatus Sumerlaeia bacterium]|nr:tetratricopeptide repeat protein [Candidatus Sumerlaeia bacterium]